MAKEAKCNTCGFTGTWKEIKGKWRIVDSDGSVHNCQGGKEDSLPRAATMGVPAKREHKSFSCSYSKDIAIALLGSGQIKSASEVETAVKYFFKVFEGLQEDAS